ncbi:MAG TPA: sulfite exporter TauE/SafE family protein [Flavisolibacter sp.]|nr:sulfite exporter TauE/SafE family protein [Flavisolibacter sp.]
MPHAELILFFALIAFIYASVGFGGGSSYLAILVFYAFPFMETRLIALVCNVIVVTGGTLVFIKHKQVDWKKIIPLALAGVIMAFLGARVKLSRESFFILLGFCLIIASVLLWIKTKAHASVRKSNSTFLRDAVLGGSIGFLSGMVGIGGGIFLSPLLNLLQWDHPKKIAATASVFILANSVAGIAGQLSQFTPGISYVRVIILGLAVFIGGQLGSRIGVVKFDQLIVKRVTAVLVFVAGVEVLSKHLHF